MKILVLCNIANYEILMPQSTLFHTIEKTVKFLYFKTTDSIPCYGHVYVSNVSGLSCTYVPDFKSDTTDGRIQIGGTKILVWIKSEGIPTAWFISNNGISCNYSEVS